MSDYLDPKTTKLIYDALNDSEESDCDNIDDCESANVNRTVFEKVSEFFDDSGSEGEVYDDLEDDPDFEVTGTSTIGNVSNDSDNNLDLDYASVPSTSFGDGLHQITNKPRPRTFLKRKIPKEVEIESEENDTDESESRLDIDIVQTVNSNCTVNRPILNSKKTTSRRNSKPTDEQLGWKSDDDQPSLPVFSERSGIKCRPTIDENSTPFDVFSIFFPENLVKQIKTESNTYARTIFDKLKRSNRIKKNSIWATWTTIKLHELYLFFSIILHMCVVKKPRLRDYWASDNFIKTAFAPSVMSRNRFLAILSNFHLNDNTTYIPFNTVGHDPCHKLRPYVDHLVSTFSECFYPYENLTVDEGTCGFRGRIRFRVYNKNKPDKYGIKLYIVCDSSTGYVLAFEVYTGKSDDSSITSLFTRLLSNYLDKGHTIYMDRFYTSPKLFDFLWEKKTKAVGTCMSNRKELPKSVTLKKLAKNEVVCKRRKHILCTKWKDTRDVLTLSTIHKNKSTEVMVRGKQGPVAKSKPDVIIDYNKNKTGVDRNDQLVAYYPFKRKQMKWWKKLFFHLFMVSISNAFILYRASRPGHLKKKCSLLKFIIAIGKSLAEKGGHLSQEQGEQDQGHRPKTSRLSGRHFPEKLPPTEKKAHPTRICKVCSDKHKQQTGKSGRKETIWFCPDCDIALCVPECFKLFHTKADYL